VLYEVGHRARRASCLERDPKPKVRNGPGSLCCQSETSRRDARTGSDEVEKKRRVFHEAFYSAGHLLGSRKRPSIRCMTGSMSFIKKVVGEYEERFIKYRGINSKKSFLHIACGETVVRPPLISPFSAGCPHQSHCQLCLAVSFDSSVDWGTEQAVGTGLGGIVHNKQFDIFGRRSGR